PIGTRCRWVSAELTSTQFRIAPMPRSKYAWLSIPPKTRRTQKRRTSYAKTTTMSRSSGGGQLTIRPSHLKPRFCSAQFKTRDKRGEGISETVKFPDDNDINCFPATISQYLVQPVGSLLFRKFL